MIKLTDRIWIGGSTDEMSIEVTRLRITGLLNVAQDLQGMRGWGYYIDYAQTGLIDGPGNPPSAYCAAILMLHTLIDRHDRVMVFCHNGGRSLAVATMYLIIKRGKVSDHPTFLNYWTPWDKMLDELAKTAEQPLPEPHRAHRRGFDKLPLALLESLV